MDGVLTPLDHDPAEIRREALLVALGGAPPPVVHRLASPTWSWRLVAARASVALLDGTPAMSWS